jgi:hypothetical protein
MVRGRFIILLFFFPCGGGSYRLAARRRGLLLLLLSLSRVVPIVIVIENVGGRVRVRVVSADRRWVTLRVSRCTRLLLSPWGGAWGEGEGAKYGEFGRHRIRVVARLFFLFFTC